MEIDIHARLVEFFITEMDIDENEPPQDGELLGDILTEEDLEELQRFLGNEFGVEEAPTQDDLWPEDHAESLTFGGLVDELESRMFIVSSS